MTLWLPFGRVSSDLRTLLKVVQKDSKPYLMMRSRGASMAVLVSCYWRERAEVAEDGTSRAVDEIASLLDAFKQDLIEQLALPSTT